MIRPDWLQQGCRVRRVYEGRIGYVGAPFMGDPSMPDAFWIEWTDTKRSYGTTAHWKEVLEPYPVENKMERKATNPKDAIGIEKAPFSVFPMPALYEGALAILEGALKYGRHNYRDAGVRYSVYLDGIVRHLSAWFEGQDQAPDSKVHHLGHVMANCAILLDDALSDNPHGIDDRPPRTHNEDWLPKFNARVKELMARYPNPCKPHTEKDID